MTKANLKKPSVKKASKKSITVSKSKPSTSKMPKESKKRKAKASKSKLIVTGGQSVKVSGSKQAKAVSLPTSASSSSTDSKVKAFKLNKTDSKLHITLSRQHKQELGLNAGILPIPASSSLSASTAQQFEQPPRIYVHAYEDPNWLGNEDDNGSVASGLLEEDFCLLCGHSTLGSDTWNSVVLCDNCEGEYHLQCIGLSKLPQSDFVCRRCEAEAQIQKSLQYKVERFPLEKPKAGDKKVIVYTPARPVEVAFKECESMGVMLVSNIFDFDIMK